MRSAPIILSLTLLLSPGCEPAVTAPEARRDRVRSMYNGYRALAFATVPEITAEDLRARLEAGETIVLVDCREDRERAVSVIPGAISKTQFETDADRHRDHRVVTYCTIGYRSGVYGRKLHAGSQDTANLAGGVLAWAHAGGDFVDPEGQPTRRVHVYGRPWDLLPEGYESVR